MNKVTAIVLAGLAALAMTLGPAGCAWLIEEAESAEPNLCSGTMLRNGRIETVHTTRGICRFDATSAFGHYILSICPVGSECEIELPATSGNDPFREVNRIKRK